MPAVPRLAPGGLYLRERHRARGQGRVEYLVACPAERLGAIHGDIRVAQEIVRPVITRRTDGDANAGCGAHVVPVQMERLLQGLSEPLRNAYRVTAVRDIIEQDHELIAAKARHRIAGAEARLPPASDRDELLIPDQM